MKIKSLLSAFAIAVTGFAAQAVTVSAASPYSFSWAYNGGAAGMLTGTGSMTFSNFSTTALKVDITLNNTSTLSSNRLTSFGFGINPDVSSVSFSDTADDGIIGAKLGDLPSLKAIEVCAFSGPNCNGGAGDGIFGKTSDSFSLTLNKKTAWGTTVEINPVGFKYQTDSGSYEFTTVTAVPEPESLAMMLAGLGLMGTIARRRKARSA